MSLGAPVIAALSVLGDEVVGLVRDIVSPLPTDDMPFPFSGGYRLGPADARAFTPACDKATSNRDAPYHGCRCGGEGRSAEYVEALSRLELLSSLTDECGDEARVSAELGKRAIVKALNAGVYAEGDTFDCWDTAERPTRGDVRLMLAAYAAEIGRLCHGSQVDALVKQASSPLEVERALTARLPRRAGTWPGLVVVVALGLGLALWWRARR